MAAKYLKSSTFLQCHSKGVDSPVWKSILKCRPLLQQGIQWKVGKGDKISFWFDNWIENRSLIEMLELSSDFVRQPHATMSDFITSQKQWNISKLNSFANNRIVIELIRGIDIINDIDDSFCWGLHSLGEFTVNSATWLAHKSTPSGGPDWEYKWVWKIDTTLKIQIFLWQIFHQALNVRGTLIRRGLHLDRS